MSNKRTIWLRLQQMHKRRAHLDARWRQAIDKNNGEARELRRKVATIDEDIDALEKQL